MPLEARIETLPERTAVITLSGTMTLGSSLKLVDSQVQSALSTGVTSLIFDLSAVDYADSAGLGLLVHTFGLMNENGGSLRLCGVQPRLRAMMQTTRTDTILTIDTSRDESLAALKA
jgi:anti-sigma B factor antagonist